VYLSRNQTAASVVAMLTVLASPAAATTPLLGAVSLGILAKANAAQQQDPFLSQSWSNIGAHPNGPKDLGHLVLDPEAKTANGAIDVKGHADLLATWDSADAGAVAVAISREIDIDKGSAPQLELLVNADWDYFFTADQDGTFNLSYLFDRDGGDLTGLGNWVFEIKGPDGLEDIDLTRSFGDSHQLSVALKAGQNYAVSLFDLDENHARDGKHLNGGYTARFDWSISPAAAAPEPSAWALMLVGVGLTGAGLRRRRKTFLRA